MGQLYFRCVTPTPAGTHTYHLLETPGVTFYPALGLLFGYPTAAGTYNFAVTATNLNKCTGSRPYAVAISPKGD